MELSQNIWGRYGSRGNPFDTGALSASADALLPIALAIVGREMDAPESRMLLGVVRSAGGVRPVAEGEIGVGKTTFTKMMRLRYSEERVVPLREGVREPSEMNRLEQPNDSKDDPYGKP